MSLPPTSLDEVRFVEGAHDLTGALRDAGYLLVVVTNQPDVARGTMAQRDAVEITELVRSELGLDDGYLCPHDNDDGCDCRKPRPGMLRRAAVDWNVDLDRSWLIGDRWVDIGAAAAAGVRSLLVEAPYSWAASGGVLPPEDLVPEASFPGLAGCVGYLLATDRS
jgi:D-glycero-D-manno-heptose 1,7-bisphosphate phosphatase